MLGSETFDITYFCCFTLYFCRISRTSRLLNFLTHSSPAIHISPPVHYNHSCEFISGFQFRRSIRRTSAYYSCFGELRLRDPHLCSEDNWGARVSRLFPGETVLSEVTVVILRRSVHHRFAACRPSMPQEFVRSEDNLDPKVGFSNSGCLAVYTGAESPTNKNE